MGEIRWANTGKLHTNLKTLHYSGIPNSDYRNVVGVVLSLGIRLFAPTANKCEQEVGKWYQDKHTDENNEKI